VKIFRRKLAVISTWSIASALIVLGSAHGSEWDSNIHAGAAKVVITPGTTDEGAPEYADHTPVFMAGFDVGRAATGVHDDLFARAAVLDIDGTRVAIVTVDLVGYSVEEVQDIRYLLPEHLGIDRLIVASTHNHEGPDTIGLWGWVDDQWPFLHSGINDLYLLTLKRKIIEAVELAVADLRFAGLRAVSTMTDDLELIRDSREPEIIDQKLTLLQAVALGGDGEVIASVANWSNHPEVLWDENTLLTADYPGYLCTRLEDEWGGTALFISGALGGLLTPVVTAHTFDEAERVGALVADRASEAMSAASPPLVLRTEITIRANDTVDIFLMNPMFRTVNELWRRSFRTLYNCGPFEWFCRDIRTEVNLISIDGVIQFVTVPGEIVPELSYEILRELEAPHQILVGLGCDELGYILPVYRYQCNGEDPRLCWPTTERDFEYPDSFFDPGDHYEETMSVGPSAAPVIMGAIFDLIAAEETGK
jgi:hypothetical protein